MENSEERIGRHELQYFRNLINHASRALSDISGNTGLPYVRKTHANEFGDSFYLAEWDNMKLKTAHEFIQRKGVCVDLHNMTVRVYTGDMHPYRDESLNSSR
jgi:hypothetical protein